MVKLFFSTIFFCFFPFLFRSFVYEILVKHKVFRSEKLIRAQWIRWFLINFHWLYSDLKKTTSLCLLAFICVYSYNRSSIRWNKCCRSMPNAPLLIVFKGYCCWVFFPQFFIIIFHQLLMKKFKRIWLKMASNSVRIIYFICFYFYLQFFCANPLNESVFGLLFRFNSDEVFHSHFFLYSSGCLMD